MPTKALEAQQETNVGRVQAGGDQGQGRNGGGGFKLEAVEQTGSGGISYPLHGMGRLEGKSS